MKKTFLSALKDTLMPSRLVYEVGAEFGQGAQRWGKPDRKDYVSLPGGGEEKKGPLECKLVPSEVSREELKKLKAEVEAKKVPKESSKYNFAETKVETSDTLESIVGRIFNKVGAPVPTGTLERIRLASGSYKGEPGTVKAETWEVKDGVLIYKAKVSGTPQVVYSINLLPWKVLAESGEVAEKLENYYDLGKYELAGGNKTGDKPVYKIDGSVDATEHKNVLRTSKWYEEKTNAAKALLKIYDDASKPNRFDVATKALIRGKEALLRELAGQADFTPIKFRTNFEKKHTADEVLGKNGVYNLVLAFQRIQDIYKGDSEKLFNDKCELALTIGASVDLQAERFSRAQIAKSAEGEDEPAVICPPEQVPNIPPPHPPVKPEPKPKPNPFPPVPGEKLGEHIRADERRPGVSAVSGVDRGDLSPGSEQFHELIDTDLTSKELIRGYTTGGFSVFLQGIDRVPVAQQQAVMDKVFQQLGVTDAVTGRRLAGDIVSGARADLLDAMKKGIDDSINAAVGENKKAWELQKMLFEGGADQVGGLKAIFDKLDSINIAGLTPELKEMVEWQKEYLDFLVRRPLALDVINTQASVIQTSVKDPEDLKEYLAKPKNEIKDELNSGTDNDEDVYLASSHVAEALRLALMYQYAVDVQNGEKIQNPVKHYYEKIKAGTLNEVTVPQGQVANVIDPLSAAQINVPAGAVFKFDTLFVDRAAEFKLFDDYQSGGENIAGTGAFMGSNIDGTGILAGSDEMFSGSLFEKGGTLGATEKLYMAKIKTLFKLGRYDEARELCVEVLQSKLESHKKLTPAEITKRADDLSSTWLTKNVAQTRLRLEEQGISSSADVVAAGLLKPNGTAPTDLNDYITAIARMHLEQRAEIQLQMEVGGDIFDKNPALIGTFSPFEKAAWEEFSDMNGYGVVDVKAENADTIIDVSEMVAELIVIELATAGLGAFAMGAAGVTRGVALGVKAGDAAATGMRGLAIGRIPATYMYGLGARAGARLAAAGGRTARIAQIAGAPARYLGEGASWHARGTGVLAHSLVLTESLNLWHEGEFLNPISKEGALQIGVMTMSMYGLNKVQQLSRGLLVSGGRATASSAAEAAARATGTPWTFSQKMLARANPINQIGSLNNLIGRGTNWVAQRGVVGYAGISAAEIGVETTMFRYLGDVETELAVATGLMTQTQAEAQAEPDEWKKWAHAFGATAGIRAWRLGTMRIKTEPIKTEPIKTEPIKTEPVKTEPVKIEPVKPEPKPEGIKGHDVDIAAKQKSEIRFLSGLARTSEGLPTGEALYGTRRVSVEPVMDGVVGREGKTLRTQYKEALRIADEPARATELARLDRLLACRTILSIGRNVEYQPYDRQGRDDALAALRAENPSGTFTPIDSGGKFYIAGRYVPVAPTAPASTTTVPVTATASSTTVAPVEAARPAAETTAPAETARPAPAVKTENLPTPALERVNKITFKDPEFPTNTKEILEHAKVNEPILLGTQITGNHLVAVKGANGKFTLIESSGKRVVRTIPDVEVEVEAVPNGDGTISARVKWQGGEYVAHETFPVEIPKVPEGTALEFKKIAQDPGSAAHRLNDTGMGVRFGTEAPGNHVDLIRLNSDTWVARRTAGGVEQPQEIVRNVNLAGDNLSGTNANGAAWSYTNAREFASLTSLEGTLHQ